jgi:hypothetical protein
MNKFLTIDNYQNVGMLVFVTFDIIPLKAKFTSKNQPHRNTCPGILHGPFII